jgi:DNA primase
MTGPAQRRPEQEQHVITVNPEALERFRESIQLRPPPRPVLERLRDALRELLNTVEHLLQQSQTSPVPQRTPQQTGPVQQPRQAPQMTQTFVYQVSLGSRTYQVALPQQLPTTRSGQVDEVAARAVLHDLLLNNKLVESGGQAVYAQVTRVGRDAESAAFNSGAPNQRLDIFRDEYVARTYTDGQYVERPDIRIAMAPQAGRRTRNP